MKRVAAWIAFILTCLACGGGSSSPQAVVVSAAVRSAPVVPDGFRDVWPIPSSSESAAWVAVSGSREVGDIVVDVHGNVLASGLHNIWPGKSPVVAHQGPDRAGVRLLPTGEAVPCAPELNVRTITSSEGRVWAVDPVGERTDQGGLTRNNYVLLDENCAVIRHYADELVSVSAFDNGRALADRPGAVPVWVALDGTLTDVPE